MQDHWSLRTWGTAVLCPYKSTRGPLRGSWQEAALTTQEEDKRQRKAGPREQEKPPCDSGRSKKAANAHEGKTKKRQTAQPLETSFEAQGKQLPLQRLAQDDGVEVRRHKVCGLAGAGGFDPVEAEESQGAAEEFGPGAAFAEEKDAKCGCGDGEQIGEGGELGGFEEAEKPEVEEISESGAEESGEGDAGPGLPGDGEPVGEGTNGDGAEDGDGEEDESPEDEIPGGHGERVVLCGDALTENDVHGEAKGTDEREGVTEERGGMAGDAGTGGEDDDAGESDEHTEGFAYGGLFETEENGEDEGVDGAHADDDGGVSDVGVTQAEAEEELVEGDTEEAEIGEGPVVTPGVACGA